MLRAAVVGGWALRWATMPYRNKAQHADVLGLIFGGAKGTRTPDLWF